MNILDFLRSFRAGPFAIFDFVATYLFAYLVGPYLKKIGIPLSREQFMYLALPLSVATHAIFGIETPLTSMVLSPHGYYVWKAIIVIMLIMVVVRREKKP